jgi:hypothetical protein
MKKYIYYSLLLLCGMNTSCNKNEQSENATMQIAILVDVTDKRIVFPEALNILSLLDMKNDSKKSVLFSLATMTDKILNPRVELFLPTDSITEIDNKADDPYFREKAILQFYKTVKEAIAKTNTIVEADSSIQFSECFSSIASELTLISRNKKSKNYLFVYSDLFENSTLYKIYAHKNNSQESIKKELEKKFTTTHLLPENLSNITVYFIFQPKTREEDQLYATVFSVYKKILTERGATVILSPNNPNYGTANF